MKQVVGLLLWRCLKSDWHSLSCCMLSFFWYPVSVRTAHLFPISIKKWRFQKWDSVLSVLFLPSLPRYPSFLSVRLPSWWRLQRSKCYSKWIIHCMHGKFSFTTEATERWSCFLFIIHASLFFLKHNHALCPTFNNHFTVLLDVLSVCLNQFCPTHTQRTTHSHCIETCHEFKIAHEPDDFGTHSFAFFFFWEWDVL